MLYTLRLILISSPGNALMITAGLPPVGLPCRRGKWLTGTSLTVMPKPGYLSEDFRVNHRAYRVDLDLVEDMAIENFESAINVPGPLPRARAARGHSNPRQTTACAADPVAAPVTSNDVVGIRLFDKRGDFV